MLCFATFGGQQSAVQQAAGATIAAAWAIIPYVFMRSIEPTAKADQQAQLDQPKVSLDF